MQSVVTKMNIELRHVYSVQNNSNFLIDYAYVYVAKFDWLEKKKFYISINSMSRKRGIIFLPLTADLCNISTKVRF